MKALITADLHLNDQARDTYRHLFLRTFRDLCRKHKVDTAIILGDLTDQKDRHSAWLVNQVVDHFYKLAGICERVIVLRGNHDYTDEEWPFFRMLRRIEGITYIGKPVGGVQGDVALVWLPHTNNPQKDWAQVSNTPNVAHIFAHQTFSGANVGGRILEGYDPDKLLPGRAPIISGDIHVPQTFGRVTYVGAPYTIDFGDVYEPRVCLFDKQGRLQTLAAIGVQKRLIEAASVQEAKRKCEKVAEKCDILKIRIHIKSMERWAEMRSEIKEWCISQGLVPYLIQPIPEARASMIKKVTNMPKSDKEVLLDYAKLRELKEPFIKTGLDILRNQSPR